MCGKPGPFPKDTGTWVERLGPSLILFIFRDGIPLERCRLDENCFFSLVLEGRVEGLRLLVVRRGESGERSGPYCRGVLSCFTSALWILSTAPFVH